jgi:glycosyltransferase
LAIIEKYNHAISKFVSEKDKGIYDALNKGIAMASGDIIGILHSDDFFTDDNVITKIVQQFTHQQCDALYADLYYVSKDNTNKIIRKWKSGELKANSFLYGWMPPHPTFFVKKDIYNKYGAFDLNFKTSADYELMLRLLYRYKVKAAYLPEYIIKMRMGGQSNVTTKNRIIANIEDRKAWEVNGVKPYFFTLFLKPMRKITQFL